MKQSKNKIPAVEKRQKKAKSLLLEALVKTPVIQIVCAKTGVSRATYYRWNKEDPGFEKEAEEALEEGVKFVSDMAKSNIIKSIGEGNLASSKYWLENHDQVYRKPKKPIEVDDKNIRLLIDV